ncbi:MAG: hypothetical protein K6F46_09495 [Desulfovibrio sp.]|nr:hypothetical protein [Desulfovibrio sp.]
MLRVLLSSCVCFLFLFSVMPVTGWARGDKGLENGGVGEFDLGQIDATAFLPKPPDAGSLLFQYDKQCYEKGKTLRQDPEIVRQAAEAADTHILPEFFSEAFGAAISRDHLPTLRGRILAVRAGLSRRLSNTSLTGASPAFSAGTPAATTAT